MSICEWPFYTGFKFKSLIIRIDLSIPSLEDSFRWQHLNELTDTVTAQSRTAYSDLQRVSIFQHMHVINNTFHLCFTVNYCKNERKIAKTKRGWSLNLVGRAVSDGNCLGVI